MPQVVSCQLVLFFKKDILTIKHCGGFFPLHCKFRSNYNKQLSDSFPFIRKIKKQSIDIWKTKQL